MPIYMSIMAPIYFKKLLLLVCVSVFFILAGCSGGSGDLEDSNPNRGWINITGSNVYLEESGQAYAYIYGTAFTNTSYSAHRCVGLCCLLCLYDDSYPGVDVVWENLTNGTNGSAESRYGTLTSWVHSWSAKVPVALGNNEVVITAFDPEWSQASETVVVEYPPLPPTQLSATNGDGQITLEWPHVLGSDSYNLYWSYSPDFTKLTASSIVNVSSPYSHYNLSNGTTYYYALTSLYDGAESKLSETISAIAGAPMPPKNISATPSGGDIILSWDSSPAATIYNIYWSNEENVTIETANVIGNVTSPYTHTGLTGIPYYYIVTAINGYGASYPSAEVSAAPQLPPPAPTNLNGTLRSVYENGWYYDVLDLEWDSIAGINQYVLHHCGVSGAYIPDTKTCFVVAGEQIYEGTENHYTDINLAPRSGHLYRVTAENDYGVSGYSNVFGIIIE